MLTQELVEIIQAERLAAARNEALARTCQQHRNALRSPHRGPLGRWLDRERPSSRER